MQVNNWCIERITFLICHTRIFKNAQTSIQYIYNIINNNILVDIHYLKKE